jgi:hypothetical protein
MFALFFQRRAIFIRAYSKAPDGAGVKQSSPAVRKTAPRIFSRDLSTRISPQVLPAVTPPGRREVRQLLLICFYLPGDGCILAI